MASDERGAVVAWLRERVKVHEEAAEMVTDPDTLLDQLVSVAIVNKWDEAKNILAAIERGDHLRDALIEIEGKP